MVVSCWVRGCTNRAEGDDKLCFFLIPKVREHEGEFTKTLTEERRRIWLANINRTEEPSKHSRICAAHFIEGRPAGMYDRANPDWVPTLNLGEIWTPSKSRKKQSNVETNQKRLPDKTKAPTMYPGCEPSCHAMFCCKHFVQSTVDRPLTIAQMRNGVFPTILNIPKHLQPSVANKRTNQTSIQARLQPDTLASDDGGQGYVSLDHNYHIVMDADGIKKKIMELEAQNSNLEKEARNAKLQEERARSTCKHLINKLMEKNLLTSELQIQLASFEEPHASQASPAACTPSQASSKTLPMKES